MLLVGAMLRGLYPFPSCCQGVFWGFPGRWRPRLSRSSSYKSLVASVQSTLPFIQLLDTGLHETGGLHDRDGIAASWLCSWFAVERHISDAMKPS